MSRVADTLFVGFAISPDHPLERPLHPDNVNVHMIATRQFQQHPEYAPIIQELEEIVREQLGVRHVFGFRERLDHIQAPLGELVVDNGRARLPNVRLAPGVSVSSSSRYLGLSLAASSFRL